jgi:hypothetical protein
MEECSRYGWYMAYDAMFGWCQKAQGARGLFAVEQEAQNRRSVAAAADLLLSPTKCQRKLDSAPQRRNVA